MCIKLNMPYYVKFSVLFTSTIKYSRQISMGFTIVNAQTDLPLVLYLVLLLLIIIMMMMTILKLLYTVAIHHQDIN